MRSSTAGTPRASTLPHAQDVGAHPSRVLVALARGRGDVADAELGQAGDVGLLGGPAHRAAVADPDAVALVDEVEVGVDLDKVERLLAVEGLDAGYGDRVVAAQHHRDGAATEDLAHGRRDVGV